MEKIKVFKIADLKDLEMQVALGDITYGRMVEILNDMAYFKYSKVKKLNEPAVSNLLKCDIGMMRTYCRFGGECEDCKHYKKY